MRRFIVPVGFWFFAAVFVGLVILLEWVAWHNKVLPRTKVAENVACTVIKPVIKANSKDSVELEMNCRGRKNVYPVDAATLVSYIADPGPLTCMFYEAGNATCVRK